VGVPDYCGSFNRTGEMVRNPPFRGPCGNWRGFDGRGTNGLLAWAGDHGSERGGCELGFVKIGILKGGRKKRGRKYQGNP